MIGLWSASQKLSGVLQALGGYLAEVVAMA